MVKWAAAAAVATAAIVAVLVGVWVATADQDLPVRINAVSAAAQAASATLVVLLTTALAYTAFGALAVGRQQAHASGEAVEAARRSNLELRIQRELSVLPFLSCEARPTEFPEHLGLELGARNQGSDAALRVTITLHQAPWDQQPPDGPEARARLLRDTPQVYEVIGADAYQPFGFQLPWSDFDDELVVRLQYSGVIGANVWQTYILRPRQRANPDWFVQMERFIRPSAPGAIPIVTRHPTVAGPGQVHFVQLAGGIAPDGTVHVEKG